jgi:hypothetical protein
MQLGEQNILFVSRAQSCTLTRRSFSVMSGGSPLKSTIHGAEVELKAAVNVDLGCAG